MFISFVRGLRLAGLAFVDCLLLIWINLCVSVVTIGIGIPLLPKALDRARARTGRQRRLAREWFGVVAEERYLPTPVTQPGFAGHLQRTWGMINDAATWRDLRWLVLNPVAGSFFGLLPALMVLDGLFGLTLPFTWKIMVDDWGWENSWYLFVPLVDQTTAYLAALLGAAQIYAGLYLSPWLLRLHGNWVGAMLDGRSRADLAERVRHLADTRSDAVSQQAAEIQRIERDLHDGAQARLVSMGMTLAAAETMLKRDPEQALALVTEAKNSSASALRELRELVRGIHPPVLSDRGLVDAVRALALTLPVHVTVTADVPGRVSPPVESAVYFVVSELLGNVVKHAHATEASVDLRYRDGRLRVTVHDDGVGGADPARGSGLTGIERRLSPFDGFITVFSPPGGTTDIAVEVPSDLVAVA
ncbi:signal transduction histidine kinase [Actinoplanes octamycinicus]|uniref:histidine kinase n=1 Tax=Actinoplanes octamycinicus TaxID=135948 RepID=A0A7W7MCH7_9ACTN|nr:sensor histidine kinase [Actinoplanes octamycinicus]MBB4745113.1 signal transduction histidine kinase [Actinoplanes octamycinicus]GIE55697.1 histidine kinase [Actinoplanes octamycinicus]